MNRRVKLAHWSFPLAIFRETPPVSAHRPLPQAVLAFSLVGTKNERGHFYAAKEKAFLFSL